MRLQTKKKNPVEALQCICGKMRSPQAVLQNRLLRPLPDPLKTVQFLNFSSQNNELLTRVTLWYFCTCVCFFSLVLKHFLLVTCQKTPGQSKVPYGKCIHSFFVLIYNCHDTHKALLSLLIICLNSPPDCTSFMMGSILKFFYEHSFLSTKLSFNKYLNKGTDKH